MRQIHTAIQTNHGVSFPLVGVGRFQQQHSACDEDQPVASTDDDEIPDSAVDSSNADSAAAADSDSADSDAADSDAADSDAKAKAADVRVDSVAT